MKGHLLCRGPFWSDAEVSLQDKDCCSRATWTSRKLATSDYVLIFHMDLTWSNPDPAKPVMASWWECDMYPQDCSLWAVTLPWPSPTELASILTFADLPQTQLSFSSPHLSVCTGGFVLLLCSGLPLIIYLFRAWFSLNILESATMHRLTWQFSCSCSPLSCKCWMSQWPYLIHV